MSFIRIDIVEGPEKGRQFVLSPPGLSIGRGADNDIVLSDASVSYRQCQVTLFDDGRPELKNLSNTNKPLVNSEPASAKVLHHADRITLGKTVLELVFESSDSPDTTGSRVMSADDADTDDASATHIIPVHMPEFPGYTVIQRVFDGGQASVYRARSTETGEVVAIKVFRGDGGSEQADKRFMQEAEILKKLYHRHIVGYKGAFSVEGEWDELRRCLVMEFLQGQTLKDCLKEFPGGMPWKQAKDIFEQCLTGLVYAQEEHGITHRDIKPSNIFVLHDGSVKLIDFGIARLNTGATLTAGSRMIGSFDYMAPDFAREKDVRFRGDQVSDIFSLFVCFFQMLTGKLPYPAFGEMQELEYLNRWHTDPPALSCDHMVFRIIDRLSGFMKKGLAVDRSDRFQSLEQALEELRSLHPRVIENPGREKYELTDGLGEGGFGEVYRARRVSDGRVVAVKRLFAERFARRFVKEAVILSRHRHPNIVEYLDFFESVSSSGRKQLFLVLEYLDGMPTSSLKYQIRHHPGRLSVETVLRMFVCYCAALDYLHCQSHSIIHRDIKPGNLYAPMARPMDAKLFDLGAARDVAGTRTVGGIPGTWDYMAPEFANGRSRGTPATDVYALGVSMYEALTGRTPYPKFSGSADELLSEYLARANGSRKLSVSFDAPVFSECPKLSGIICRSIAMNPAQRYESAGQMQADIMSVLKESFDVDPSEFAGLDAAAGPSRELEGVVDEKEFDVPKITMAGFQSPSTLRIICGRLLPFLLFVAALINAWLYRGEIASMATRLSVLAGVRFKPAPDLATTETSQIVNADSEQDIQVPGEQTVEPVPETVVPEPKLRDTADETQSKLKSEPVIATNTVPPPPADPDEAAVNRLVTLIESKTEPPFAPDYTTFLAAVELRVRTIRGKDDFKRLGDRGRIRDAMKQFWFKMMDYAVSETRQKNDLSFLGAARGCLYSVLPLYKGTDATDSITDLCETVMNDWQQRLKSVDLAEYLPVRTTPGFRFRKTPQGHYRISAFLDSVFRKEQAVSAVILPHAADLELRAIDGADNALRESSLPFVLIPDGNIPGTGAIQNPFYMTAIEITLGAVRTYRDDAARWGDRQADSFSGVVREVPLGDNDLPFYRARPGEAIEFCNWLSFREGLPECYARGSDGKWTVDLTTPGYRLPTVKEWEFAARYGFDCCRQNKAQSWKQIRSHIHDNRLVWYSYKDMPRKSGVSPESKYPSGLYDMCGNVEEICMDETGLTADRIGRMGTVFVLKGGSAKSRTVMEVMPESEKRELDETHEFVGFRVVRPVPIARF